MTNKINKKGFDLITKFEGLELQSYEDSAGVWTIGYGHTSGVTKGMTIDKRTALIWLSQDLEHAEKTVSRMVKVPLTDNMFSSLVSFVFNLGSGNFSKSSLLEKINDKDYGNAANEFPKWIHAGGKPLLGLLKRRIAERSLFLEP